jgi:hypothetical protein
MFLEPPFQVYDLRQVTDTGWASVSSSIHRGEHICLSKESGGSNIMTDTKPDLKVEKRKPLAEGDEQNPSVLGHCGSSEAEGRSRM